jgi:hypothetical protein
MADMFACGKKAEAAVLFGHRSKKVVSAASSASVAGRTSRTTPSRVVSWWLIAESVVIESLLKSELTGGRMNAPLGAKEQSRLDLDQIGLIMTRLSE